MNDDAHLEYSAYTPFMAPCANSVNIFKQLRYVDVVIYSLISDFNI